MLLIKGAEVYAPEYLGKKDVLIAGEKIERIGEDLPEYEGCQVIDGTGRIVAPGFIDRHVHITGGGGEGSFHTQAPQVQLSDLIRGGVTTVVGLLGTDGISRSTENLVAKAKALSPVFEALERTSIPVKTFQPTHVGRAKKLQEDAFKLAKMGGTIDFTCGQFEEKIKELAASLRAAKEAGVPMDKVTISSDGQGSWSNYDAAGNLTEMGVSSVDTMYRQVVYQVQNENMSLEEALSLGTRNVAKALEVYPKKGAVHVGSDADVLVLNGDLSMNTVIARGSLMMQDGVLLKKGTYEA